MVNTASNTVVEPILQEPNKAESSEVIKQDSSAAMPNVVVPESVNVAPEKEEIPSQNGQPKKASALSLASIRNRKQLASSLEKVVVNPDDLPKQPFTHEELMGEWEYYINRLTRDGLMLMASLMRMARPILNGASIKLELPNQGSKVSFEEYKYDLVNYLRKKLQNFDIELFIEVNEEFKVVNKVLDSKDKYLYFVEKNAEIEEIKKIFDLEIK